MLNTRNANLHINQTHTHTSEIETNPKNRLDKHTYREKMMKVIYYKIITINKVANAND